MKEKTRGKRLLSILLACIMMIGLVPAVALAAVSVVPAQSVFNIEVVKKWDDEGNEGKRPDSIEVTLKANEVNVDKLTLTDKNKWTVVFEDKPILGTDGKVIVYTVQEGEVENYTVQYTQPAVSPITLTFGDKITPASKSSYPVGGNVVVANKGNKYYIWTENELNTAQKSYLLNAVNEKKLQGLGKDLTQDNTEFRDGLPAYFSDDSISIQSSDNNKRIYFSTTNVWSLFYVGNLIIKDKATATITNTYSPASTSVSFSVKKEDDEENPLAKAKFTLSSQNSDRKFTRVSDSNGIATFTGIPDGTYTLYEEEAPDGYIKLNTSYTVTINKNNPTDATADPITVVDAQTAVGTAHATFADGATIATFVNQKNKMVQFVLPIKKTVNGKGAPADQTFTFELLRLVGEDNNEPIFEVVGEFTKVAGAYTWTVEFPYSELDLLALYIREKQENVPGWTYDDTLYVIRADENNDYAVTYTTYEAPTGPSYPVAEFVNSYDNGGAINPDDNTNPDAGVTVPKTGDNSNMFLWIAMLLASALGFTCTALYGRKKRTTK